MPALNEGAEWIDGGARRYKVDTSQFDAVFDSLCCAIFFERYGQKFDPRLYSMNHIYLSFKSDDPAQNTSQDNARGWMAAFFNAFPDKVTHTEAAKIDEVVYANSILDPRADRASITITHTFYGCFEVISLLKTRAPMFLMGRMP